MFMRQILADAISKFQKITRHDISKFQKITRQMLCDKCSKNDVTLIPQTSYGGKITLFLKMLTSYGGKILPDGGYYTTHILGSLLVQIHL